MAQEASRTAVVIGINYTPLLPGGSATEPDGAGHGTLRFAEADAQSMAAALQQAGYQVETLVGAEASRTAIGQSIRLQTLIAGADGACLVYFAGHGQIDPFNTQA